MPPVLSVSDALATAFADATAAGYRTGPNAEVALVEALDLEVQDAKVLSDGIRTTALSGDEPALLGGCAGTMAELFDVAAELRDEPH